MRAHCARFVICEILAVANRGDQVNRAGLGGEVEVVFALAHHQPAQLDGAEAVGDGVRFHRDRGGEYRARPVITLGL